LSSYGTIAYSNNYSLITLNRIILTYLFTGNGIFQTAIQLPIQDALSKGIEIESGEMSPKEIDQLLEWMESPFEGDIESFTPWEIILNMYTWVRLYGGGGAVINNGEDPAEVLSYENLGNNPLELYDIDRWQMDFGAYMYRDELFYDDWMDREFFYIHGVKIHKSRILRSRGKRAPYYVRRQLRGWGMSEGERMIRDLNIFLKTQDVLYEIVDESKVDIYKIKGFANKLLNRGGTEMIQNRVMLANELKSYVNALVLDIDEEFEQKSMTFTGLAEVMRENRINVASALRMPMTKLFGLSASGFNTGESDLENYNSMVESQVRTPIKPIIREFIKIGLSKLFGYVPNFKIKFPSLRVLSALDDEQVKTSQQNRALTLYDRGIIDSYEVAQMGAKQKWLEIKTKAEQGLIEAQPTPPNEGEFIKTPSLSPGGKSRLQPKEEGKYKEEGK
jgi:phage-related protein (TIGR01555 family)